MRGLASTDERRVVGRDQAASGLWVSDPLRQECVGPPEALAEAATLWRDWIPGPHTSSAQPKPQTEKQVVPAGLPLPRPISEVRRGGIAEERSDAPAPRGALPAAPQPETAPEALLWAWDWHLQLDLTEFFNIRKLCNLSRASLRDPYPAGRRDSTWLGEGRMGEK